MCLFLCENITAALKASKLNNLSHIYLVETTLLVEM